ncbi:MAG TPA: protein-tyrosine-phosphatase [Stellaceae bacterium]|nr:protein-tyrosine-phosphatase [Stellaceae bacterium]
MVENVPASLRLTICGLDELAACGVDDVTHVLSILDPGWPEPEALRRFDLHRRLKLRFHDVIEPGIGLIAPQSWDVGVLLAFGRGLVPPADAEGVHLLIHCHAGVSRSTAAAILVLAQRDPKRAAPWIVREVVRLRPRAWPNLRMIELGDALLGRGGELIAAVRAHYRIALAREPWLADAMIDGGRGREVMAAD